MEDVKEGAIEPNGLRLNPEVQYIDEERGHQGLIGHNAR
jgi:hypothetical protein